MMHISTPRPKTAGFGSVRRLSWRAVIVGEGVGDRRVVLERLAVTLNGQELDRATDARRTAAYQAWEGADQNHEKDVSARKLRGRARQTVVEEIF